MTLEHINNTLQSLLVNTRSTGETYRMYLLMLFKTYYDMLEMSKSDIERYCFIASPYEDVLENVKMYNRQNEKSDFAKRKVHFYKLKSTPFFIHFSKCSIAI